MGKSLDTKNKLSSLHYMNEDRSLDPSYHFLPTPHTRKAKLRTQGTLLSSITTTFSRWSRVLWGQLSFSISPKNWPNIRPYICPDNCPKNCSNNCRNSCPSHCSKNCFNTCPNNKRNNKRKVIGFSSNINRGILFHTACPRWYKTH